MTPISNTPLAQLKDSSLLKTNALINGQWVGGSSRFGVFDPSNGVQLAEVANMTVSDAEQAIAAANAAWPAWREKTVKERSIILRKWYDLLMQHQDDIARIMTAEQGKPYAEAKGETVYGASFVEWYAIISKYRNAGQTCVCANRFYVQDGVYDEFVRKFTDKVKTLKVGNGFVDGVTQGPLIEPAAVEKVNRHIADALSKGGQLTAGGHAVAGEGLFFEPTVIAQATADMLCAKEETFGPFAPIFRFKTEKEAIDAANNTEFGLASYFYSRDVGRLFRVSEALEYGMVGINVGVIASEHVPFGGVKQSGLGREGSHHGMDEYVEIKYLCVGDVL